MALDEYRRRRDFRKTPEPSGGDGGGRGGRGFVIQKHDASHLHYDLRLELGGVLRSWAVPRGPSLDPSVRRLAVQVEDHPVEYGDFEGIIPEGEYGGGTVLLWDRGRWAPSDPPGDDPAKALEAGHLRFQLEGERLRGRWHLVRAGGGRAGKPRWLLFKDDDDDARRGAEGEITRRETTSVASGRSIEDISANPDATWTADAPPERARRSRPPAKRAARPLPRALAPPLATLVEEAPDGDGWLHEIKYDGYRILARVEEGRARLVSRRGNDWTTRFPPVAAWLARLPVSNAAIDGEVAVLTREGRTDFQALQRWLRSGSGTLVFYAFDLPFLEGADLRSRPLRERKEALQTLLRSAPAPGPVRYSDHVAGRGPGFHREACAMGVEGIVSKRADSRYRAGRSRDWRKVKCLVRQEFVIAGWTEPTGTRARFGALLLGVYDAEGRLVPAGKVGTGFDAASLSEVHDRLRPLERKTSPFSGTGRTRPAGVHWVRPELVCEVAFSEWTADGILRQPVFHGLREDKPPGEVVRERPLPENPGTASPPASEARPPRAREDVGAVAGIRISSPEKPVFPARGITKLALARYYEEVGEWTLPHLADRPLTLVRCPDGVGGACFYQKHADRQLGTEIGRVPIEEGDGKKRNYAYVDTVRGVVSLVQMGVLELHTSNARRDRFERPDRFVLDLDPGSGVPWKRTVEAAREVRAVLEELGLESWVKTTGGIGLHVVVPLVRRHGWDDVRSFSRGVAYEVARRHPERYVTRASLKARRGKIYLDYLRNGRGATSVAAFCVRARPSAAVSVPLSWEELAPSLDPDTFTPDAVLRRMAALDRDPWEGYARTKQTLTRAMREALPEPD